MKANGPRSKVKYVIADPVGIVPMKRLLNGYHTVCHDCKENFENSRDNLDMHMAKHGAPDNNTCANCGQIKPADSLSTYRVWYGESEADR